jgi:uncharacterized membrane protein
MTKEQFLGELRSHLATGSDAERAEVMMDYEHHFASGLAAGRTEEEICNALGDPKTIAHAYAFQATVKRATASPSTVEMVRGLMKGFAMFLVLAPVNFLVLVGPFLVSIALLFAGWLVPFILFIVCSMLGLFAVLPAFFLGGMGIGFTVGSLVLGGACTALFFALIMFGATRLLAKGFLSYLSWNVNLISGSKPASLL